MILCIATQNMKTVSLNLIIVDLDTKLYIW